MVVWSIAKHHVVIVTNTTFDEDCFPKCSKGQEDTPISISIPDDKESNQESEAPQPRSPDQYEQMPIPAPRGNLPQPLPLRFYGYRLFLELSELSEPSETFHYHLLNNLFSLNLLLSNIIFLPNLVSRRINLIHAKELIYIKDIHQKKRYLISDSPPTPPTPSHERVWYIPKSVLANWMPPR